MDEKLLLEKMQKAFGVEVDFTAIEEKHARKRKEDKILEQFAGALIGGKKEPDDVTPYDALKREISEEVGKTPAIKKIVPLELFTSNDQKFQYNTYVLVVEKEFIPQLNEEHAGYAWCDLNCWPKPLHQGVKRSLSSKINKSKIEVILDLLQ